MSCFQDSEEIPYQLVTQLRDAVHAIARYLKVGDDSAGFLVPKILGITDVQYKWAKVFELSLLRLKKEFHFKMSDTDIGRCVPGKGKHKTADAIRKARERQDMGKDRNEFDLVRSFDTEEQLKWVAGYAFACMSVEQKETACEAYILLHGTGIDIWESSHEIPQPWQGVYFPEADIWSLSPCHAGTKITNGVNTITFPDF